ncbi:hypothetical protein V2J09_021931 [Rumex salicifolius]
MQYDASVSHQQQFSKKFVKMCKMVIICLLLYYQFKTKSRTIISRLQLLSKPFGLINITIANPSGYVTGIRFNGVDNLLETDNEESNRGYFDIVWNATPGGNNSSIIGGSDWLVQSSLEAEFASLDLYDVKWRLSAKIFKVISKGSYRTEISFSAKWDKFTWNTDSPTSPINFDRRYVMPKGLAGFYSYTILESEPSYPDTRIHQIRSGYKLHKDRFHYMAISDDRQRLMPMPEDRATGQVLNYKEAVRLIAPENPEMKGEVDDKYQYLCDDKENKVHGWMASNPAIGFWIITSDDFRTAGPFKQDHTSHTGPTCLQMFHSAHYAGADLVIELKQGEAWKKMMEETQNWPYDFPQSMDFAKPRQRGSVSGQLFVKDRKKTNFVAFLIYGKNPVSPASNAWVGLAAVGKAAPFDLIHCDLWTSPVMSVSGYKYYLVIIDDFSHYIWCFPLKYKYDTAAYLKQFHAYVQTQFPLKLKSIQCDHGREFDNNDLHSFFSNHGVLLRFSCPHTSQQNGKAERMIRTITNTIRTLLFHGHLPPRFWVEALNTATYLLNITPTTTLAMRTPHQLLFNQLPSYGHLRVFGCLCYPNLTATTKHKLEPRTRPCVFLGYALKHRGYRCLDLANHKVIISRHVIFDESVFPFTTADPGAFPTPSPSTDDTIPLIVADPTNFSQPVVPSITTTPAPASSAPQIPQPAAPNPPPLLTYSRRARPMPPAPVLTYSRRPAPPRPPPLTR